ncbi:hypothetical protein [Chrysodeixis includens nucleopolyhedrovirus]|uniref:Ac108 n=1 Tax=Chrysodeixis includens nucleopolyhedrovirus TaxID=1207438 RepID=A0A5B8YRX8_9ABAC|nr:hypothetical protein QKU06_gp088 [Chrysodeixis includens nucleopolyhedrovirus]QED40616.1 hypothetical protein [Chrysodeixis includens nucleopolyhedrovirus]
MRRLARDTVYSGDASSILNQDQLEQLVTRNRTFLRDFLLVICGLVVFVVILMFIVLIFNISQTLELNKQRQQRREETFLANLDYRYRQGPD